MHSATWTASECQPGKAISSCPSGLSSVDSIHLSTHFRDISNHNRLPWGTSLTAFWRWCGLSGAAHQQGQNVYRAVLASFGFNELPSSHLVWEQKFPLGHSVPQLKRSLVQGRGVVLGALIYTLKICSLTKAPILINRFSTLIQI